MNTIAHAPIKTAGIIPAEHPDAVRPTPHPEADPGRLDFLLAKAAEDVTPAMLRPATAVQLLGKAQEVMASRAQEYDKPGGERSVPAVVTALNAVLGRDALTVAEGWLFLQLLKNVRLFSAPGYHADSGLDGVAYSALMAEAKARES